MKPILFAIAIFCSTTVLAQDTTRSIKVMSMKGSDLNRMFGNVTDRKIYQRDGTIVDSVKAAAMVKSFEYETGFGTPIGQTEMKRIITRIDPKHKMETYQLMKIIQQMRLKSTRLQDGLTLDLKPIAKSVDTTKLTGKAIIMIFWCRGCYNGTRHDEYREVNNVISTYYNPDKLQVIAITNSPFDVAADELKKSPILNARNVFEGGFIASVYQTDNRPVIVMTDKAHKILFSVANNTAVTTWMPNKLLKENL